ncbi:hypothetical protein GOP47_0013987 [Adiantum capillus-veneris]|uniref:Protein kinase domain-containing protein n=1 Tax=Adiantum capillus-veneris TaxID=13818 RepID=A0A9D4UPS7_ADICA|nr:hypothetical protein GOP47_0013987 [Adiantum capillus-veneris]
MARRVLFRQSSGAAASSSGAGSSSKAQEEDDHKQREVELLYLAHQGLVSHVDALLSEGVVLVNFADFDGRTALHIAACEGHLDVVRLLVSKGADVNARDRWGSTPLDDAEHYQNGDVCKQLIEYGGKLCHKTPLQILDSLSISEYEVNPAELNYLDKTVTKRGYKVATWRGIEVFVKCFKALNYGEKEIMTFRCELSLIQKLRHPNIVQFLGAVTKSNPVMIIFEFLPQGDLYQFLKQKGALKSSKAIDFSLDIARGLNFMHEHRPEAIIHRDLKPKNILRDNSGHLKVADLGLSKVLKFAAQTISEDGPPPLKGSSCRYMAPEVFKDNAYGKTVDVFAFGLIVQEMIEGVQPMWGMDNDKVPRAYADENKRPPFKASLRHYPGDLKKLIEECWDKDPKKRPTFTHIIDRLESIKAKQRKTIWRVATLWSQ